MQKSIVLIIILMLFTTVTIAACGGEDTTEKKPDAKEISAADTTETGEVVKDAMGDDGEAPIIAGDQTTTTGAEGDLVLTEETVDGAVTTEGEEQIKTVLNDDGTVTVVDETGAVVASATSPSSSIGTADGTVETTSTTTTAPVEEKIPATRGEVNIKNKVAIMNTNFGEVYIFFFEKEAPNHTRNFIYLAQHGFYDNVKFHRIIKNFMAQGGMARPDWTEPVPQLKLETDKSLNARHRRGTLSAARTNVPDSATSQFFLCFSEEGTKSLDWDKCRDGKGYTAYGQVFRGFETLDKLEGVKLGKSPNGEISTPLQDVHIVDVKIVDGAPYAEEIAKWKSENNVK